jgi:hypothetical protein
VGSELGVVSSNAEMLQVAACQGGELLLTCLHGIFLPQLCDILLVAVLF